LKKFHFNLEKILNLRKYRERETELELGRAIGELTEIERRIADLALERLRAVEQRFSAGPREAEIFSFDLYIRRLDHTRDKLLEAAARAELKVEKARSLYLEASRDRKILDKLKDKREREYRKTIFTGEIKAADDISGGAAARKQTGGVLL
jgi:flagellar FliJ protein